MTHGAAAHAEDFRAGHALGVDHRKVGMWLFIASEVMFFGGLLATYLHYKYALGFPEASGLNIVQVGINTTILLPAGRAGLSAI
jgi:heme/copper-type cytochrome/quinol oxidase subunit 3